VTVFQWPFAAIENTCRLTGSLLVVSDTWCRGKRMPHHTSAGFLPRPCYRQPLHRSLSWGQATLQSRRFRQNRRGLARFRLPKVAPTRTNQAHNRHLGLLDDEGMQAHPSPAPHLLCFQDETQRTLRNQEWSSECLLQEPKQLDSLLRVAGRRGQDCGHTADQSCRSWLVHGNPQSA
jgi:hypothetical protein